jgi:hypothetical protein
MEIGFVPVLRGWEGRMGVGWGVGGWEDSMRRNGSRKMGWGDGMGRWG